MSLGIQPLDDAYLTGIFDELAKLEVQLDSDPLVYGPKRLNQKVALVRKMTTQCERMFLDAAQKHAHYKRSQRAADLVLDMSMKHLIANDPEVRAGRAQPEREAIASGKLKTEVQEVAAAKQAIEDLEAVIAVIKAKRSDLRDIQGRLRDQMRLCQEEIGLGNRWGSKNPRGVEVQPGQGYADGDDVSAIDDVITAVRNVDDAEVHLEAEVDDTDTEAEEVVSLLASADDADALLAEFVESGPQTSPLPVGVQDPETDPLDPGLYEADPILDASEPVVPEEGPGVEALEGVKEVSGAEALPGTVDQEEVTRFLAGSLESPSAPKKTRFQVEEEDGMDLESILANFEL